MNFLKELNTVIVNNEFDNLADFSNTLSNQFDELIAYHVIIDISNLKKVTNKDLSVFSDLIKVSKKNKKSFVIVLTDFDFNKANSKINIVPTIQEAHDIIEMEEIERDLGF